MQSSNNRYPGIKFTSAFAVLALSCVLFHTPAQAQTPEVPPGFHLMPDGRIMANNPATAIAPPGYYLRSNGVLLKLNNELTSEAPPAKQLAPGEVPQGFHKMPDGRIMAIDPATAVAPPGYHMMPGGMLMSNTAGGHHHGAGMWMFDYKYVRMKMSGLLDTTNKITASQAVDQQGNYKFMMAPVSMNMDMHMFMAMYGVTNDLMLMGMAHYMFNSMDMLSLDGTKSTMSNSGFGDTIVTAMINGPLHLTFNFGLSLPTGSINERGLMIHTATARNEDQKYPYGMQLGSGSVDLVQSVAYEDSWNMLGWGAGYEYIARLKKNKYNYKRGNKLVADAWMSVAMLDYLTAKGKLQYNSIEQIEGYDSEIKTANVFGEGMMSPAMDETAYGGTRIDAVASLIFKIPKPMISITAEFALPLYQNLWGPQMATSWVAGLQVGLMIH